MEFANTGIKHICMFSVINVFQKSVRFLSRSMPKELTCDIFRLILSFGNTSCISENCVKKMDKNQIPCQVVRNKL